ncbi:hypothetical protein BJ508DRAFT_316159 [Ascobolus immersus RN42]|uniref:Uncharacterized protein n=1 Tax=Ascobolus immersus RN42 TaxID=1160509 RepID=A0A3N4HEJ3_ASCIM|nr:hypothetical protein BJ508DRAFT_316159 [Ascobolus immersus RN42]
MQPESQAPESFSTSNRKSQSSRSRSRSLLNNTNTSSMDDTDSDVEESPRRAPPASDPTPAQPLRLKALLQVDEALAKLTEMQTVIQKAIEFENEVDKFDKAHAEWRELNAGCPSDRGQSSRSRSGLGSDREPRAGGNQGSAFGETHRVRTLSDSEDEMGKRDGRAVAFWKRLSGKDGKTSRKALSDVVEAAAPILHVRVKNAGESTSTPTGVVMSNLWMV